MRACGVREIIRIRMYACVLLCILTKSAGFKGFREVNIRINNLD